MNALIALAWTVPPSAAFVAWAWVRLLRERDSKLAAAQAKLLDSCVDSFTLHEQQIDALHLRVAASEQHIGQLTDKAFR